MRVELPTSVDRVRSSPRTITKIVVLEGAEWVVLGADLQDKALATLNHDTGRPDLDLERHDLTGPQLLQLVVGVERTPRL